MVKRIGVIIVLYNVAYCEVLSKITKQGYEIILIDNTPKQDLQLSNYEITYFPLKENKGIAYAQNLGIDIARKKSCSHIVFLDQDSNIGSDFVSSITEEYYRLSEKLVQLFALGPTAINGRTKEEYQPVFKTNSKDDFIRKNEIISSGSCIAIEKIEKVGGLCNNLFIDYVDNEWIWRARKYGFVSGITSRVKMIHFIGQQDIKLLSYSFRVSSPIRYYYQTRNYLWLLTLRYVPLHWKCTSFVKVLLLPWLLPFRIKGWKPIIKNLVRGFKDGITKRKTFMINEDKL